MNFLLRERKKCLCNLLPLIVLLFFLIYFSEIANSQAAVSRSWGTQEQGKVQNTSTVDEITMLPYENFDIGLSIEYGSNWNYTEGSYDAPNVLANVTSVLFYPIQERNYTSESSTEIRIFSYPLNEIFYYAVNDDASLDEVAKETVFQYSTYYPHFNLISSEPINLTSTSAPPSYELGYEHMDYDSHDLVRKREIITMTNDKVYSISYSASQEEFPRYLSTFDRMINSESFQVYNVSMYEKPGINSSGIILRYPEMRDPWGITEIDNNNVNFMIKDRIDPSIKMDFILSVYQFNKSLPELGDDLRREYGNKQNFTILDENNNTYAINTTLDGNVSAHKIVFSYHDNTIKKDIKGVRVHSVFNNNAFVVTYLSESLFYDMFLPTAEEMIDSLEIIDPIRYTNFNTTDHVLLQEMKYPAGWYFMPTVGIGFQIISPLENNSTDKFNETLDIQISAADIRTLDDHISDWTNSIKQQKQTNFQYHESEESTLFGNPAHKIVYTYRDEFCQCDVKEMDIFTVRDKKLYRASYLAEPDKYYTYLSTIQDIINSTKIPEAAKRDTATKTGLQLNGGPIDVAINPFTNRLYIAIPEARQLQVIDGSTDQVIENIIIGAYTGGIAVNPYTNKIYVASPETDIVYAIDGLTNNVTGKIQAGPVVGEIAVDTNEFGGYTTLVFDTNQWNDSISIIDDIKGEVVYNIETNDGPFGVAIDSMKNRAYVTTNNGIDIIDYTTNSTERSVSASFYDTIYMADIPLGIAVNSNTSELYIANSASDTVSVIDTVSNKELKKIPVGLFPSYLALDPSDKKLYVTSTAFNTVSIINTTDKTIVANIPTDSIPFDVGVNPNTNIIYLANFESKTLSTINGTAEQSVSALTFRVNPSEAGHIVCYEKYENGTVKKDTVKKIPENTYHRIIIGNECKAVSNSGFAFSSWSNNTGVPSYNSTGIPGGNTPFDTLSRIITPLFGGSINSTNDSFNVTQYGVYTANFSSGSEIIQVASPYISIGGLVSVVLLATIKPTFHIRKKGHKEKEQNSENNEQTIPNSPSTHRSESIKKDEKEKQQKKEEVNEEDGSKLLSKSDIITIDATVLVGVLVFLSFTEGFEASEQYQINVITGSIVFPFAISAIIGVTKREKYAARLMIAGFINLMISIILIAIMKL